jgi:hypothetical protein
VHLSLKGLWEHWEGTEGWKPPWHCLFNSPLPNEGKLSFLLSHSQSISFLINFTVTFTIPSKKTMDKLQSERKPLQNIEKLVYRIHTELLQLNNRNNSIFKIGKLNAEKLKQIP